MSDRPINLLLIDPDSIYRTGLRVVLERESQLRVAAEAGDSPVILQNLLALDIDIAIVELRLTGSQVMGWQLCQQLKTQYPSVPILILTCHPEPTQLAAARQAGVEGFCRKGIAAADLINLIQQLAVGRSDWEEIEETRGNLPLSTPNSRRFTILRHNLRRSGLQQIDGNLAQVTARLQEPGLPTLDRAMLAGQRRELLAARWVVERLLTVRNEGQGDQGTRGQRGQEGQGRQGVQRENSLLAPGSLVRTSGSAPIPTPPLNIFASTRERLEFSLENLTRSPLEIDIFREDKKRELLNLILRKIEDILADLRFSQVQSGQLPAMRSLLLRDLWQATTVDFFGRYSTLLVDGITVDFVNSLLQDEIIVRAAILDRIPLVSDLFSYLLFASPLAIDNSSLAAGSLEAKERTEAILQNLTIQMANAVVQPLLNQFADLEFIKQNYYDRRLISTREIERFRNNLSWKYRVKVYFEEPRQIFESCYELLILAPRGIAKIAIYAPRNRELAQLSGIPLMVTLALELRDAIAPRLQAVVSFVGSGIIFVLTQVIGKTIGLIGRGVLQGLSSSWQESKNKRL
jgi:DNA-binding NarL/FixJ family response regulator